MKRYLIGDDGRYVGSRLAEFARGEGVEDAPPGTPLLDGHDWYRRGGEWVMLPIERPPAPVRVLANEIVRAIARVELERERRIASGADFVFGGSADRVQTRPIDLRNLQSVQGTALTLVISGVTAAVIPFRALSNTDYMLTPTEALTLCGAVAQWGTTCYQWSWSAKAAIESASSVEAIDLILSSEGL
jgi:hypothetical protein